MDEKIRSIKDKASNYAKKGQNRKAIREYEILLKRMPGDSRSLHRLGELWAREGNQAQSIQFFLKAADGYSEDGFPERSVAVLKQALAVDPKRLEISIRLADAYLLKGFERDAMVVLRRAASTFEKAKMETEELTVLLRMVELEPGDVDSRMNLARLYVQKNRPEKAREELLQAAMVLHKTNRTNEFIAVSERVIQLGEVDLELHRLLATCYLQRSDWEKAQNVLEKPLNAHSDDFQALDLSARILIGKREFSRAAAIYKRMARIAKSQGDEQHASEALEKLQEISSMYVPTSARSAPEPTQPPPLDEYAIGDEENTPEFPIPPELFDVKGPEPDPRPDLADSDENTMLVAIKDVLSEVSRANLPDGSEPDVDNEGNSGLGDGLNEVDFLIGQGLLDEAADLLGNLVTSHSGHPEIVERQQELLQLVFMVETDDTDG